MWKEKQRIVQWSLLLFIFIFKGFVFAKPNQAFIHLLIYILKSKENYVKYCRKEFDLLL